MEELNTPKSYMDYWHFSKDVKEQLITKLILALPTLRGAVGASQDEIANVIGLSRQTYNSIELRKRKMTWGTYMALMLFFDYNPLSHNTIRQLEVFPYQLDECWLSGKIVQVIGDKS